MSAGVGGGRVRSASPSRRALAIDMRRIANLLRDPAGAAAAGEASMNTSICSSPQSTWEPGDRGAAPTGSSARAASVSRMVMQNQFTALAERINMGVTTLQRQCEADRRRIQHLEKKFEAKLDERTEKSDGRERWAEIQGSVNGLLEETQALTRRVEGLDERLWARTSGSEMTKQRNRELEQQVQALEQQSRLSAATVEETQKRQSTKLRRSEHALEEVVRRLTKVEEEVRLKNAAQRDGYLEARINAFEQTQESIEAELRTLQANLEEGLAMVQEDVATGQDGGSADAPGDLDEAVRAAEMGLSSLEKKVTSQIEDVSSSLASLRVKMEGQISRVSSLADRLETAHEPAIESLRGELSQARLQDRRELESEVHSLKSRIQEAQDTSEETAGELREALRQARAEFAALRLRPEAMPEDNSNWIRSMEDRLAGHEQEIFDLRTRTESLPEAGDIVAETQAAEVEAKLPEDDLEDLRRRLEWIEEQGAAGAASSKVEVSQISQVQNTVCDLVEQVSRLKQQASSSEASLNSWHQQVQHLQGLIEKRQNEDSSSLRVTSEVQAKVGAVSSQVADIAARLLEVEGNMDFVRENETANLGEVSALSAISEAGSAMHGKSVPPLPKAEADHASSSGRGEAPNALQEKLEAVAEHLEVVDELAERVAEIERRFGGDGHTIGGASPGPASEVSFGGDGPFKVAGASSSESFMKELSDLQSRFASADKDITSLRQGLARASDGKSEAMEAVKSQVDALRKEFDDKLKKESVSPKASSGADLREVRADIEDLQSKVDSAVEDLGEGLLAAKEAVDSCMAPIRQELKDLRAASADDKAGKALQGFEQVEEKLTSFGKELEALKKNSISEKVSELQAKLERMEQSPAKSPRAGAGGALARLDTLEGQIEEVLSLPKKLEDGLKDVAAEEARQKKRLDELDSSVKAKSSLSEALQKEVSELSQQVSKEVADVKAQLKNEVESIGKRLGEVSVSKDDGAQKKEVEIQESLGKLESQLKQAQDAIGKLQETPKASPQAPAADMDELKGQLSPEDSKLRLQVQEQVQELTKQLSKELASLAEQQKDMIETGVTVQDLAAKMSEKGTSGSGQEEAIQSLKKDVARAVDRLSSLEKSSVQVQKDLEGVLGPRNKVGISLTAGSESPLAEVRGRLDQLFEQVAELQTKADDDSAGASGRGSAGGSKSRSPKKQPMASPDASLNFSLTEQTERPGAAEGSLNFSLTEQTNKEMSVSEPPSRRPAGLGLGGSEGAEVDSDIDDILSTSVSPAGGGKAVDELVKDKGSKPGGNASDTASSALGGRPRPSPVKTEEERPLTSVAEEASMSDLGEPSPNSKGSGAGRSTKSKDVSPAGASVESPMGGSGGALEASMMSQVSIGCDYSVDDSLELENKCDFVEVVRPVSSTNKKKAMGIAGSTIPEAGEDAAEVDLPKPATAKPAASVVLSPVGSKPADKKSPTGTTSPIGTGTAGQILQAEKKSPTGAKLPVGTGIAGQTPQAGKAAPDALDLLTKPKGAAKGGDALDSLLAKPKATPSLKSSNIDALDSLLGGPTGLGKPKSPSGLSIKSPASSSKSPKGSKSPTAKTKATPSPDKADDAEYSASFEDDMSVAESIEEESMEGSGSGAWGSGEAV